MSETETQNQTYTGRLRSCYKYLARSRVVNRRETDEEALEYFQRFCNDTIPKNAHEAEIRDTLRNMYYTNKTSFIQCINKDPHLVLLTEARAIVVHFGIHDLIYIQWTNGSYLVKKNEIPQTPERFQTKKNKAKKFPPHVELLERIYKLEQSLKENNNSKSDVQTVEPDLDDLDEQPEVELEKKSPTDKKDKNKKLWSDE